MTITLHTDPAPLRVDDTGAIRVGESRVTLDVLLEYLQTGMTPDEITRGLDSLTLADVHGALSYYFRHRVEMDEYLHNRASEALRLRDQIATANAAHLASLKTRLDAVRAERNGGHASTAD